MGARSAPDTASFTDSPRPIRLDGDHVTGFGNDVLVRVRRVVGSRFDDVMVNGNLSRRLWGSDGDDTIDGRGGDDVLDADYLARGVAVAMWGGFGDDQFYGGPGMEMVNAGWHRAGDVCFSELAESVGCEFLRRWP